jgi:hypothetical protein
MRPTPARCAAIVLLFAIATSASAQYPGSPSGGRPAPGGAAAARGQPPQGVAAPAGPASSPMIQVQLDQLEDELKLTTEQYPDWNRYADSVAALMDDIRRARQPGTTTPAHANDQFDALVAVAHQRVASLERIAEAGKNLYATLTPAQKQVADRRMARVVAPSLGLVAAPAK